MVYGILWVRTRRDQADRYGIRSQNCSRYVLHLTSLPPTLLILAHSLTMGRPFRNVWYRNISSNTSLTKISSSTRLERGMARWPSTSLASSGAPFQTLRAYLITHRGDKWSSSKDAGRTLCHVASLRQYHLQEYLSLGSTSRVIYYEWMLSCVIRFFRSRSTCSSQAGQLCLRHDPLDYHSLEPHQALITADVSGSRTRSSPHSSTLLVRGGNLYNPPTPPRTHTTAPIGP